MSELRFPAMGSDIRLILGAPTRAGVADPEAALAAARAWTEDYSARLSRFRADSELSALNADPHPIVPASELLCAAVGAGIWAAERSGGLVDPTLVGELEAVGYARSRAGVAPAPLREALAVAPPPRPARPDPRGRWRRIRVLPDAVVRPPGVRLDTGGTGKGLAADALLVRLRGYDRVAIDCGGDLRVGGPGAASEPFAVEVQHPVTGELLGGLSLAGGAVATSGLDVNVWRRPDGSFAHHLLDPATGAPAWTGLVGATALAPSALEAETLAKTAVLRGPAGARAVLAEHGGIAFHADGRTETIGRLAGLAVPCAA